MSDGIEYAARRDSPSSESPFPEHWRERSFDELGVVDRAGWINANIAEDRRLGIPSTHRRSFVNEHGQRVGRKSGAEVLREHLKTPRNPL